MMTIPRGLARSFRAVVRKAQVVRPRPPAPPVLVETRDGGLHLSCALDGVTVRLNVPCPESVPERILVPMEVFDAVEGAAVMIEVTDRKGMARWEGRDGPKSLAFKLEEAEAGLAADETETELQPVAAPFLAALHECGRTAAREPERYALHRVQVNGKTGTVSATDGKIALVQRGFTLPFREAILVPALPVFGTKELAGEKEVSIGRSAQHLLVRAGTWMVALLIDEDGRFPDVAGVIPKSATATVVGVDDRDARELLARLIEWPETSDGTAAVTLDVDEGVAVRVRHDVTDEEYEFRLLHSTWAGPALRVALDRRHLSRALTLGFRTFRLTAGQPVVAEGPDRLLLAATLDVGHVVGPKPSATVPPLPSTDLRRLPPMKSDSHGPPPLATEGPTEWIDPLVEAESLRTALTEAATRLSRLLQSLKQLKRPRRVLENVLSRTKTFGSGSGGES